MADEEEKKKDQGKEKNEETDGLEELEKEDLLELVRTLKANEKKAEEKKAEEKKETDKEKRKEIMKRFLHGDAQIKTNGGNASTDEDMDEDEVLKKLRNKLKGR